MADPRALGRAALSIGGAYFFGPVGAIVGGIVGDLLFPVEAGKGPRLNELNVQHSTVGAPIPIVYGTAALAGNVIWSGGLLETEHEQETGGKGGGSGPKTYSYAIDCAIGICEGPIDGVRRIWADADLIYDASDDATLEARIGDVDDLAGLIQGIRAMSAQLDFELYLGTEDQLPDPTIESYKGAGNVPGYRGLAYIVFNQFQLEKYGNRIPNFRFEVYTGAPTECGIYSGGHLEPWAFQTDSSVRDPRNPANNHTYGYVEGGGTATHSFDFAIADMEASYSGRQFLVGEFTTSLDSQYIHGWSTSTTPNQVAPCLLTGSGAIADYIEVEMSLNSLHNIDRQCCDPSDLGCGAGIASWLGAPDVVKHAQCGNGRYMVLAAPGTAIEDLFEGIGWVTGGADPDGVCLNAQTGFGFTTNRWFLHDGQFGVRRTILPPDPCAFGTPLAGAPGYCVVNGQVTQGITWTAVSGTFKVLQKYDDNGGTPGLVLKYPVNPCLISTDPSYNSQAYWEAAYAQALADGEPIASGLVYGVDYPEISSSAYFAECDTVDVECVPMAVIVSDICRRSGLRTDTSTQIDVSGLTSCVPGYVIGRQMSGRDALGPLRAYGLFDAVETNALLKFVERGAAIVETLTADDLGVHENGSQAPTVMEVTRVQEKDLPRRLRLHFTNFEHDHEVSEQSASRITTEAIDELDVELPISMNPDTAAQLAEIMLYAQWVGRNTYRFALDNSRLALEPTDCLEIPVDGETVRCRLVAVDYSIGGILRCDAVRDDDGSYVSTAVAQPSQPSGGVPGSHGNGPVCPSEVVLLDLPRLNPAHTDAGYYAAIYGLCNWTCAELYRSDDGGLTYGRVGRTDVETTVGEILDITGPATDPTLPGDSPPYDTSSAMTVTLFTGELSSITDAQIDAGQNMAAVGVDGRWVIIQFKTATLDTVGQYTLTDIIWGVNDTSHLLGTTVDGDTFVLLSDTGLLRIPESPDAIGVEKQFKIISCGESIDAVTEFDFTTWGLSYRRLCPSTVLSATLTDPPDDAADGDSYLLPNDTSLSGVWENHGGEIATWRDDLDNWDYCTPVPGTIIHVEDEEDSSGGGGDVISGGDGTYTPAPWAPTNAAYVTHEDERDRLPNSLPLIAGDNISFVQDSSGLIIHGAAGGGTGGGGGATLGCLVHRAASQATTANVGYTVVWDTEVQDDADFWDVGDPTKLTIPTTGWYILSGIGHWADGSVKQAFFRVNGASVGEEEFIPRLGSGSTSIAASIGVAQTRYLTAGDYVQLNLTARETGSLTTATASIVLIAGGTGGFDTGGGTTLEFQDEGIDLAEVNTVNFVGDGVTATLDSSGVLDVYIPGGSGTGGAGDCLVGEAIVTGSAQTTLTVSGLDLDADESYYISFELDNATGSVANVNLFFNGDTTATNYDNQRMTVVNTGIAGGRFNAATLIVGIGGSETASGYGTLRRNFDGLARTFAFASTGNTTTLDWLSVVHGWRTSANVTEITISSDVASSLAVGSSLKVYRQCGGGGDTSDIGIALDELTDVAIDSSLADGDVLQYQGTAGWVNVPAPSLAVGGMVFVAESIVTGSPVTSISISGLDLSADEHYVVYASLDNGSAFTINVNLNYNGDTTATNYRTHLVFVAGGVGGGNASRLMATDAALSGMLTGEAGVWELHITRDFDGRARCIWHMQRASSTALTFATGAHLWETGFANVTSLAITANAANAWSVGSYVRIYRVTSP